MYPTQSAIIGSSGASFCARRRLLQRLREALIRIRDEDVQPVSPEGRELVSHPVQFTQDLVHPHMVAGLMKDEPRVEQGGQERRVELSSPVEMLERLRVVGEEQLEAEDELTIGVVARRALNDDAVVGSPVDGHRAHHLLAERVDRLHRHAPVGTHRIERVPQRAVHGVGDSRPGSAVCHLASSTSPIRPFRHRRPPPAPGSDRARPLPRNPPRLPRRAPWC